MNLPFMQTMTMAKVRILVINTRAFTDGELAPTAAVCESKYGALNPADTIEVHYVYATADIESGSTLGACLSDSVMNPQLRVEVVVMALVNDSSAKAVSLMKQVYTACVT